MCPAGVKCPGCVCRVQCPLWLGATWQSWVPGRPPAQGHSSSLTQVPPRRDRHYGEGSSWWPSGQVLGLGWARAWGPGLVSGGNPRGAHGHIWVWREEGEEAQRLLRRQHRTTWGPRAGKQLSPRGVSVLGLRGAGTEVLLQGTWGCHSQADPDPSVWVTGHIVPERCLLGATGGRPVPDLLQRQPGQDILFLILTPGASLPPTFPCPPQETLQPLRTSPLQPRPVAAPALRTSATSSPWSWNEAPPGWGWA